MGRKVRGVVLFGGGREQVPIPQFGWGRGLPPCQVLSSSIQPFGRNTPTSQTGQTRHRLLVCNLGALCQNGWMDQDETWHGGRPRPRPHCVRRERAPPQKGAQSPIFRPVCCGQTAGWIKMPLGREVGYRPGDIMLHGNPAPLLKEGHNSPRIFGPCLLWQNGWMDQDATW